MNENKIVSKHNTRYSFTTVIDEHSFITDSNDEGPSEGPGPKKLMLAALSGCTGIDVVSILDKMKVHYSDFTITINATLSDTHPKIYTQVQIIYSIKLDESDRQKMEKAVKLSEEKYCGVSAMFQAFAQVKTTIVYL